MGDEPKKKRGTRAGHQRERDYKKRLEADGWYVMRSPASKGVADLIAIKPFAFPELAPYPSLCRVLFIEVKSTTRGPFAGFPPKDREELIEAACASGATPLLVWWPPRKQPVEIPVSEWPATREAA
jgi:Holliday junction resolvase